MSGFVTKRETVADGEGLFPIYIHPAACPEARRQYGPENLIGRCDSRRSVRCTPAFDDWGPRLLEGPGLLLMDELGFLERDARRFQEAVLAALRGDQPVLAAVKNRNDPFLQAVRGAPGVRVLYITRENREHQWLSSAHGSSFCYSSAVGHGKYRGSPRNSICRAS